MAKGGLLSNPSTTPCLALRSQGHPLLKRRPAAAKDALDVCPQLSTSSSGQIEQRSSAGKINLHYPPLVIHLLIAQNLWPPLIAGICLVDPKLVVQQTGWWHKHRSNYCIAGTPPLLSCNLAIWSARHLLAVRGSNRVHTGITSAGSALCTKMPPRHIHQNALSVHVAPKSRN